MSNTPTEKRILVTAALPYANGSIHLGHMVEYLQADFFVRYQKMRGRDCIYICADDTHGTPIMIRARQEGIAPEELIARNKEAHLRDFQDFGVVFDHFHDTNQPENRELCEAMYRALEASGHVVRRTIEQLWCETCGIWLPDRYVIGTCPNPVCKAPEQYGDACEACGHHNQPLDLIDPVCAQCRRTPVRRESEHLFFALSRYTEFLDSWTAAHLQPEVRNYVAEWIKAGLRDWDFTRDAPYFGFEIPGAPGKYFYVWFDAPIGYISSTEAYCRKTGRDFDAYWRKGGLEACPPGDTAIYHFIGKDIVYFHTLYWPAMLKGAGFSVPAGVFVHGFLTVDGEKMSKSKGTFIQARTYLNHLDPEYLRYYYACKLGPAADDVDLSLDDFVARVNSDLVGKIVNIASRSARMVTEHLGRKLGEVTPVARALLADFRSKLPEVEACYEAREFSKVARTACALADVANRYIDDRAPWNQLKQRDLEGALDACTGALNHLRFIAGLLKPFLPKLAAGVEKLLRIEPLTWDDLGAEVYLEKREISTYERLLERVDKKKIEAMVQETRGDRVEYEAIKKRGTAEPKAAEPKSGSEPPGRVDMDTFLKLDLRVARIEKAEVVDGADRLLRLEISLGPSDTRTVFAGIRQAYPDPGKLVGRRVAVVANLEPRKMKFGTSEAMVLAAGPGGKDVFLLAPDAGAEPGMRIR